MKKLLSTLAILNLVFLMGCETEPLDKADPNKVIQVDSELYDLVTKAASNDFENPITCIDFNYPFTLIVYNESMEIIAYETIGTDIYFSEFLGSLEAGKSISLSYPITSILDNGEPYEINNNEELKDAIDKCIKADTVGNCNNILTAPDCIWTITHLEGPNAQYTGATFQVTNFGNAGLHYNDEAFAGTWITYFIEDELHLNIYITGNESISEDWNYDWKILDFNENEMTISNNIDTFKISKNCGEPCQKFLFEECETEPGSGKAIFNLESYGWCIYSLIALRDGDDIALRYFENLEDLLAGTNQITNLLYENSMNPMIIYVRIEDTITGEMIAIVPIILKAINCQA
ncbi:hypothetical protein [Aequorivita echinoideorum]|uniref:Lipocalin-like domain-containing protein n=1 Tax=Aequorivita echinoideorum TaxID=1549647 RepID=A0ABS5S257_9FLAO|nr:hypothetical protein [Aequorivita echinoideorum]MBT0607292.1 hypothetical protein [Aequorivita echinoideorum]